MSRAMSASLGIEPRQPRELGFPANLQVTCQVVAGFADKHPSVFTACFVTALRDQIGADRAKALIDAMFKEIRK